MKLTGKLLLAAASAMAVGAVVIPNSCPNPIPPFPCTLSTATAPTSGHDVHPLRPQMRKRARGFARHFPQHIALQASLGDTIPAGSAMLDGPYLGGSLEISDYRGKTYAGGRDPGAITIPNLLQVYKVLPLWPVTNTTAAWKTHLKDGLTRIKKKVPRAFVNVIPLIDVRFAINRERFISGPNQWSGLSFNNQLSQLAAARALDGTTPAAQSHQCFCSDFPATLPDMKKIYQAFNNATKDVVNSLEQTSHFKVVVQSSMENLSLVTTGPSFLSAFDCTNANLCTNQYAAGQLWNNLFQAPGHKTSAPNSEGFEWYCPSATDYLQ
ncbi:hypothetical protein BDK51DRAFT_31556 [Blyttiomyces helicus]|uniref:Uncharacterized protein n=1 Tax=Blyttiomyces helicus TaxID=388810 RepID=A0A4P9WA32_9FUNG|nr:hypothetical protein BDK51DRAFT_31556 [Blyttiomyces helicus]|eukprot:RKO88385.1 hypothetical protein BDK51DRAFT_31556 [Blyttiomyces helicus]